MKQAISSFLFAVATITPITIGMYIDRTDHGGSTFCDRFDDGTVELTFENREKDARATFSQIVSRVRRQMRGSSFAREAAFAAELPRRTGCTNDTFKRFSRDRRNTPGVVGVFNPPTVGSEGI
jgi:hypothetical protein